MNQVTDVLAQALYKHQTGADWGATQPATKVTWRNHAAPFAQALQDAGLLTDETTLRDRIANGPTHATRLKHDHNKTCKGQTK